MKKWRYYLLLPFVFSCTSPKLVSSNSDEKQVKEKASNVHIQLTTTASYCGGAYPSDETLAQLRTPKPESQVKIFIRKGSENDLSKPVFKEDVSDASGKISLFLPPGTYAVVYANKADSTHYKSLLSTFHTTTQYRTKIDKACLDAWVKKPELVITVTANEAVESTLNRHVNCSWNSVPCSGYTGPLPP